VVVTGSRDGIDSGLFTSAGPASAGAGALLVSANRLEVSSGADLVATSAGAADAGDISLAAGRLALRDDASLDARSTGTGDGGDVTVIATESVVLSAGFSTIQTNAFPGAGGDVRIEAPGIEIVDLARIRSFGGARGGDIVLTGDRLLLAGSGIETGSEFQAPGAVRIVADDIEIRDSFVLDRAGGDADVAAGEGIRLEGARVRILENSFLDAGGSLSGAPGAPIEITATESILIENASVSSVGEVAGPGGHIAIRSPAVVVSGGLLQVGTNPIFFFVSDGFEVPLSTAASGSIRVEADRLVVANGGSLSSNTNETTGGPVEIEVRELLLESGGAIDAGVTQDFVGNSAIAGPLGGRIAIRAERVSLSGGARITTSATRLPDALDAGAGAVDRVFRAGDVQIQTRNLALASDSSIASTATENDVAGSVRISGADDVRLDRSAITVTAEDGDAGDIAIEASGTVFLDDVSTVTASVTGGDGGNVRIASPDFLILRRGSSVVAQAVQGNGGAIAITASLVFLIDSPPPSASSQFGLDGVVEVNPPDVDLAGTLAVLPAAFADASDLLKDPCSARDPAAASGSFRVALRSGLSSGPDDLLAAPVAFAGRGPGVRPGAGPARPVAGWVGCRAGVW
jgi:large exoprotein involved in heme utilization and adhesion